MKTGRLPKSPTTEDYIDIEELVLKLSVSHSFIFRLQAEEGLPHHKFGRATRYRISEVVAFLEERRRRHE